MNEELKKFYEALVKDNVLPNDLDFSAFESKLQSKTDREGFYNALVQDGVLPSNLEFDAFQNRLGFEQAPEGEGFLDYITQAGDYALSSLAAQWHSGADASLIDNFNKSVEDASDLSDDEFEALADAIQRQNKHSKKIADIGDVGGENNMFVEGIEKFGDLSLSVVGSMLGLINNTVSEPGRNLGIIGGATAAGAGVGATGFSAGPVGAVTTTGGALLGFKQGVGAAQSIGAADIEAANHFFGEVQQYAQDNGLNIEKKSDLQKVFQDKPFMNKLMADSAVRGSTVGGVEFIGNQIAPGLGRATSKLLKPIVKSGVSNAVLREGAASIVEGVAGGTGEALGSVFIGDEIDWANVRDEALAEILPGGAVRAINNSADKIVNRKAHSARKNMINAALNNDTESFNQGVDTALETGVLKAEQAEALKDNMESYQRLAQAAPKDILKNSTDRKEFIELTAEKLSIDQEISKLNQQMSIVDESIQDRVQVKIDKLNKTKDKINDSLKGLIGDNRLSKDPDGEKIHEIKTKVVLAANQLNQPLTRADVSVQKKNGKFDIQVQGKPIDILLLQTMDDIGASGSVATTNQASERGRGTSDPSPVINESDRKFRDIIFSEPDTTPTVVNENTTNTVVEEKQLSDFEASTDRSQLKGQRVNYLGQDGIFTIEDGVPYVIYDDGSKANVESGLNPDITNVELGLLETNQPSKVDDSNIGDVAFDEEKNTITAYGKKFDIVKPRYDGNGNVTSILVKDEAGKNRTLRSSKVLGLLPTSTKKVTTENLVQVEDQDVDAGFTPFEQAEFEILERREEPASLEEELSQYAELLSDEIKDNPEFQSVENSFTEPFDQRGVASERGLKGAVINKANTSVVAQAVLDGKGVFAKKIRDIIGSDTIKDIRTKAQRWRDLSSKTSPSELRNKRARAISEERSKKIDQFLERRYPGITARKTKLKEQIKTVSKFLPDVTFRLFESPEAFKDVTGYKTVGGFYDPETNTVYVNPEHANERTIVHEATHAAFLRIFGRGSRDALVIHQTIQRVLENGTPAEKRLAKKLDAFVDRYSTDDLTNADKRSGITLGDLRAEEYFAELTAYLVENKQKINKPRFKKLKQMLNKMIQQFTGLTLFDEDSAINDVIDFMNDLSGGIRKGVNFDNVFGDKPLTNDIASTDVDGHFNNQEGKRFQHTRVSGQQEVDFRLAENKKSAGGRIFNDFIQEVRDVALEYKKNKGFQLGDPGIITKLDKEFSKEIGKAYMSAPNSPNDPTVRSAYEAMARETGEQYKAMLKAGIKLEMYQGKGEPYVNSQEMMKDLRDNKHMFIFSTEEGFGTTGISETDRVNNILLADSGYTDVNGRKMLNNDLFRGVHDYFGHAARGNGFGAIGEENAWDEHVRMFTPLAARAMTAETRGQNSWVNFSGVNDEAKSLYREARRLKKEGNLEKAAEIRQKANEMFQFAPQKMTVLPEKYSTPSNGLRFQKGDKNNSKRNLVLNNLKANKDQLLKVYKDADTVYSKFKGDFDKNGVTLGDVQRVMIGLDPNKDVNDYVQEAQRIIEAARDSMRQANFTDEQIDANITVFEDVAKRWAKNTGRRPEEFFGEIIADFKFIADPSQLTGDVLYDAQNVTRGIWDFLKKLLPFSRSKKYNEQLTDKTRDNVSTPFNEDRDLESTSEGLEYRVKNDRIIRGARKVTTDGRAIIYLTSDADVKTPVHELAHVYEMYMSDQDRQTVLNWTGENRWSTSTSEKFARGFESFLQTKTLSSTNKKLNKVFESFKNWLFDIYNGRVRYGGDVLKMNRPMRELYANMFDSELQNYNLQEDVEAAHTKAYNDAKSEGVKYNKETFDRIILTHFDNPTIAYQNTSIRSLVREAVRRDFHQPVVAINLAMKALDTMANNLRTKGIADPSITVVESIGMSDAVMTLEGEIDGLNRMIDSGRLTGEALSEALLRRDNLRDDAKVISEVLSHWRSSSGLALGIGSKLFKASNFSEQSIDVEIERVNKIRKDQKIEQLSQKEKDQIKKQGEKLRQLARDLKEVRSKEEEFVRTNKIQAANQHIRNIFDIPYFNQVFEELKNFSAERLDQRQTEILDFIDDYYNKHGKVLFDEDVDPYIEFVEQLAQLVAVTVKRNPTLNNIEDVASIINALDPRVGENAVVDAVLTFTGSNSGVVNRLNQNKNNLKKEAKLVDQVDKMIKGILKPEIKALNSLEKTEKVKQLEEIIASIDRLAIEGSDNLDGLDLQYALGQLKALEDNYKDLMFGAMKRDEGVIDGGIRPTEITESDVIRMVKNLEKYKEARLQLKFENQIDLYERKLQEIDKDVQDLNNLHSGDFSDNPRALYRELARKYNINTPETTIPVDPDFVKLKRKIQAEKRALYELLDRKTKKPLTLFIDEVTNTPRALILSTDYSFLFYQGGLMTWKGLTSNPLQTLTNIKNTIHASFSQAKYDDMVDQIKGSTYLDKDGNTVYAYYEASDLGLNVTGIEGSTLEEELQIKSVLERVPFIGRAFTSARQFSERAYNSYLVALRLQEYMKLAQGIDSTVAKEKLAEYVNTFTGSSQRFFKDETKNRKFNNLIDGAAKPFIAPRLYASTFKSFVELTTLPTFLKMLKSTDPEIRKMYRRRVMSNLHVLKGQALLIGSMYALTSAFGEEGDDEEMFDTFSSKFLKSKFGQTVVAFSPHGLYFRFVARMFAKLQGAAHDVDVGPRKFAEMSPADAVWHEFLDTRLNPLYTSTMALAFNRDYRWKRIPEDEQLTTRIIGSILPIPLQGVADNLKEGNWNELSYEFALDMAGFNSYTVEPFKSTGMQNYLKGQNFNFRISYPKTMDKTQHLTRARFRKKVEDEFTSQVENLVMQGKKPNKAYMSKLKKQIELRVARDMK